MSTPATDRPRFMLADYTAARARVRANLADATVSDLECVREFEGQDSPLVKAHQDARIDSLRLLANPVIHKAMSDTATARPPVRKKAHRTSEAEIDKMLSSFS